jgi:3'-5' exonuclease
MGKYLPSPEEWVRLRDYLMKQEEVGLDTEFDKGTTQVTVWSLAAFSPTGRQHPRGYTSSVGYCLPREALETFKPLFESDSVRKWLHNAPSDSKSIYDSCGAVLANACCTLQWSRVAMPGMDGYGLKPLAIKCLGKPWRPDFATVTGYKRLEYKVKKVKSKVCSCGVPKCKKRLGHKRTDVVTENREEHWVDDNYKPSEIVPGHAIWDAWVDYAIEDAVEALELADWLRKKKCDNPGDPYSAEAARVARSMEWRN